MGFKIRKKRKLCFVNFTTDAIGREINWRSITGKKTCFTTFLECTEYTHDLRSGSTGDKTSRHNVEEERAQKVKNILIF